MSLRMLCLVVFNLELTVSITASTLSNLVVPADISPYLIMLPPFTHPFAHSFDRMIPPPPFAPLVGWISGPWCIKAKSPLILWVNLPCRCVSQIKYACIFLSVMSQAMNSSFSSASLRPCTFWAMMRKWSLAEWVSVALGSSFCGS